MKLSSMVFNLFFQTSVEWRLEVRVPGEGTTMSCTAGAEGWRGLRPNTAL